MVTHELGMFLSIRKTSCNPMESSFLAVYVISVTTNMCQNNSFPSHNTLFFIGTYVLFCPVGGGRGGGGGKSYLEVAIFQNKRIIFITKYQMTNSLLASEENCSLEFFYAQKIKFQNVKNFTI